MCKSEEYREFSSKWQLSQSRFTSLGALESIQVVDTIEQIYEMQHLLLDHETKAITYGRRITFGED